MKTCGKCGGRLETGFVVDNTYGGRSAAVWASGQPVRNIWTGVSLKGRSVRPLTAWRCQSCGFVEHYA